MRIAVFDYKLISTNPVGSCHLRMLQKLSKEHDFVVFAVQFQNPDPQRIRFVRVPVPTRPLALLFILFHLVAPFCYGWFRIRTGQRFDLVQTVESNSLVRNDIVYAHFCHKHFLRQHWNAVKIGGLRGFLRWLDHFLHRVMEPPAFARAKRIVVPSNGLARELRLQYPSAGDKVEVLANPVDTERMRPPADFDRARRRAELGLGSDDIGLLFVALGHFERKGLPLILNAMKNLPPNVKLHVVGGEKSLTDAYHQQAQALGIGQRVAFHGMQRDVRPFLWASDLFCLPSVYEVFPLVVLEAAASATPILATPLNGVEDFIRDGFNGLIVQRSVDGVQRGIERFVSMTPQQRKELALQAQSDVQNYSISVFGDNWRHVYERAAPPVVAEPHPVSRHRL
jgi:glycosyltransferase involved in cell wall biosynthesis